MQKLLPCPLPKWMLCGLSPSIRLSLHFLHLPAISPFSDCFPHGRAFLYIWWSIPFEGEYSISLSSVDSKTMFEKHTFRDINVMAEEAKRRAEIARLAVPFKPWCQMELLSLLVFKSLHQVVMCRLRELHTLKGKMESFAKLRGLSIDVNPHCTVWSAPWLLQIDLLCISSCLFRFYYFDPVLFTHLFFTNCLLLRLHKD